MYIQGTSSCRYTTYILGMYQVYQPLFQTRFFSRPGSLVSVNAHMGVGNHEAVIPHATRATRSGGKGCQQKAQADLPAASACATGRLLVFLRRHSLTRCCLRLGGVLVTTRGAGVVLVVVVTRFVAAVAVTAVAVAVTGGGVGVGCVGPSRRQCGVCVGIAFANYSISSSEKEHLEFLVRLKSVVFVMSRLAESKQPIS